jgi:hypothetical protein
VIRVAVMMDKTVRALNDWRWQRRARKWRRADYVAHAEAESSRRLVATADAGGVGAPASAVFEIRIVTAESDRAGHDHDRIIVSGPGRSGLRSSGLLRRFPWRSAIDQQETATSLS